MKIFFIDLKQWECEESKIGIALVDFHHLYYFRLVRLLNHNPISSIQYLEKLRNEKICLFCYNICPRVPRVLTKSSFERWRVGGGIGFASHYHFANIPSSPNKIFIWFFPRDHYFNNCQNDFAIILLKNGNTFLQKRCFYIFGDIW